RAKNDYANARVSQKKMHAPVREDQRQNAQHRLDVESHPVTPGEHLLERIQRAGADVALDHARGGDHDDERRPTGGLYGACAGLVHVMRLPDGKNSMWRLRSAESK